jgi:hypothetical protein
VVRRRGRQSGRKLTVSSRAAHLGPHWSCQYVVIGQEKHRNSTGQNAAYCMTACSTCHTRDTSDGCSIGLQPGRDPARRHASATLHPGRPICLLADFQAIGTGLGMTCQNSSRLALRLNLVSRETHSPIHIWQVTDMASPDLSPQNSCMADVNWVTAARPTWRPQRANEAMSRDSRSADNSLWTGETIYSLSRRRP